MIGKSIRKDKRAFTGLEAAIVLTAFVVVAAVFSYVVLNAGFFTTEKSKQVVHAGVEQATSSLELAGNVIGAGDGTNLTNITVYLQLTAGGNPVDMTTLRISFTNPRGHWGNVSYTHTPRGGDTDALLEFGELRKIYVDISDGNKPVGANEKFTFEIKPPHGSTITIMRRVPAAVDTYMDLT
jgi:flagellin FlaB